MIFRRSSFKRLLKDFYKKEKRPDYRIFKRMVPTLYSERERQTFWNKLNPTQKIRVGVVGAPLVYGQPLIGTDAAPGLLRESGLVRRLKRSGAAVVDYRDLQFEIVPDDKDIVRDVKYSRTVGKASKQIAEKVQEVMKDKRVCLLLGGDHSVSIGSVWGHSNQKPDTALIWVDAHTDINTPLTSASGNVHGMVLGFLTKELHHKCLPLPGLEWCKPCISAKQVAYIGIRSVDPGEEKFLRDLDICSFWMHDIQQLGIEEVLRRALQKVDPENNRPLHLSLDVDAIDPKHIPATGTPVPGGLSVKEALKMAKIIHKTGRLSIMDVTELNPLLCSKEEARMSAEIILELILQTFLRKQWRPNFRSSRK